ncbi:MAG: hypothetical protein ABIH34_03990 [Nanoarchaeota archaeon]
MKKIVRLLKELKGEMVKVTLLHSFLDSAILFLMLALIFTLININLFYLGPPLIVLFLLLVTMKVKRNHLRQIERRHPEVNEMLRTAQDTKEDESFMVRAFQYDLFQAIKFVDSATFLNMPRVLTKMTLVVLLSIATVTLAATSFHLFDVGQYVNEGIEAIAKFNPGDLIPGGEITQDDNLAKLGDQQQDIRLNPLSYELDLTSISDPELEEMQEEQLNAFPVEAVQAESYEERIPAAQRQIVKNYFQMIRSEG